MKENRWELAQEYEKEWWDSRREALSLDFFKHFAEDLNLILNGILEI